ncbi:MAG: hypothetical protein IJT32_01905 [Lachnospiraceae bacterium]|nr:hypothetical protein [Lachnospiraceae bacterium]
MNEKASARQAGKRAWSRQQIRGLVHNVLKRITQAVLLALLAVVLLYGVYVSYRDHTRVDYLASLDETAVTVDGEDLTLSDLGFYVLYEEQQIENKAEIYNAQSTKDFWNIHVNGIFIQAQAKKAALDMAVHDRIFYRAATTDGFVLTSEEKQLLENTRTDFWSDLYDEQKERLPGTYESINETMKEIALAQKYQAHLAKEKGTTYAGFGYDGLDYKQLLKTEHKIKVNKKIWDRVVFGDITLKHSSVSYINGYEGEMKE